MKCGAPYNYNFLNEIEDYYFVEKLSQIIALTFITASNIQTTQSNMLLQLDLYFLAVLKRLLFNFEFVLMINFMFMSILLMFNYIKMIKKVIFNINIFCNIFYIIYIVLIKVMY